MVNSDDALYMAHEFELTGVTGKVITGYENVHMTSGEELAPLLYPVALRLEKAAFSAIEQGYRLKIYDAYRPRKATKALYNQAIGLKDEPIPEKTYTGKVLDDLPELPPLPPNEKPTLPEGPEPPEGTEETTAPEEERRLTYEQLMTDFGRYTMSYFLAAGRSMHNRGTALDLTLADAATGEELPMQTSIHDLSWYSEISRNNANARTLASIMKGAGFGGLSSEWWHFQDNEVNKSLNPEYRMEGVSPECWMADDLGWRYRRADGTYYKDCTVQIDEVSYTFDEKGYLLQEER
jgi:D-alanyl-D-alanine dipeptidase